MSEGLLADSQEAVEAEAQADKRQSGKEAQGNRSGTVELNENVLMYWGFLCITL
jgi:hypothetical protein